MSLTRDFRWSEEDYSLKEFVEYFETYLPEIVCVTEGFCGFNENLYSYSSEEVYRITHIQKQARVIVSNKRGQYISIPVKHPLKFHLIKNGKKYPACRLQQIITAGDQGLCIVAEKADYVTYWTSSSVQHKMKLDTLTIQKLYEETYLVGNIIQEGRLQKEAVIIPVYVPIKLSMAEGLVSGTRADFVKIKKDFQVMLSNAANGKVTGNLDIMLYKGDLRQEGCDHYEYIKPEHFIKTDGISETSVSALAVQWTTSDIYHGLQKPPPLPERKHRAPRQPPQEVTCSTQYPWSNCVDDVTDNSHRNDAKGTKEKKNRRKKGSEHPKNTDGQVPVNHDVRAHTFVNSKQLTEGLSNSTYMTANVTHDASRVVFNTKGVSSTYLHSDTKTPAKSQIRPESTPVGVNINQPMSFVMDHVDRRSKGLEFEQRNSDHVTVRYDYMDMNKSKNKPLNIKTLVDSESDSYSVHHNPTDIDVAVGNEYVPNLNPPMPHNLVSHFEYDYADSHRIPLPRSTLQNQPSRLMRNKGQPDQPPPLPPRQRTSYNRLSDIPHDITTLSVDDIVDILRLLKLDSGEQCAHLFGKKQIDGRMLIKLSREMLVRHIGLNELDALLVFEFAHESWRPNDR